MEWIIAHYRDILAVIGGLVSVATIIVGLTPTTKDDEIKERRYVASKNGKMYYPLGCASAKRIKPENEVWFSTENEAIKSGYTKSSMCK